MSYRTRLKLKQEQNQNGKWYMTNKVSINFGGGTMLCATQFVEFDTHTIKDAIASIELEEIDELHIIKKV